MAHAANSVFLLFSFTPALHDICSFLKIDPGNTYSLTGEKSIKIDDVRRLQSELTNRGEERTIVLYPAEKITAPAQHALLKLLEEPPHGVSIFLAGSSTRDVLPTILSRCRIQIAGEESEQNVTTHLSCWLEQKSQAKTWKQKVELVGDILQRKDALVSELQTELAHHRSEPAAADDLLAILQVLEAMKSNVSAQLAVENWIYGKNYF